MPKLYVKRHAVTQPSDPSYRLIPLTQGQNAIVDTEDYDWLNQFNWCAWWSPKTKSFYAIRRQESKTVYMHREIMKCEKDLEIDHKNHDTLDNHKKNLRKATTLQNSRNQRLRVTNTSGFMGVVKRKNRWIAQLSGHHVGVFNTIEEAIKARDKAAKKIYGEFASLNQIESRGSTDSSAVSANSSITSTPTSGNNPLRD